MKAVKRLLSRLVVTTALGALFAFLVPVFVDSGKYAVAVSNYVKNPTLDNAVVVAEERAKNKRIALIMHLEARGILFVLINLG